MRYRSKTIFYVIAASLISCAATILLMRGGVGNTVIMSAREYKEYSQLIALDELADKIEDEFYERAPSRDTLVAGAASGMVSTLEDPYACYYTAEEYQQHLSSMNGEYYGIGLLVGQPDAVGAAVLEVYEGGTSEAAGIKVGDIITHIDGEPTANMLLEELSAAIDAREKEGVLLTLLRNDQTIEISVAGGNIAVKHVEYRMLDGNIGYIAISMFTGNCADEFEEAMAELKGRGMNSLIIDLRNNPGGLLTSVEDVLILFLQVSWRCRDTLVRFVTILAGTVSRGELLFLFHSPRPLTATITNTLIIITNMMDAIACTSAKPVFMPKPVFIPNPV